ncbi:phosphoribosylanthranilate isomerase [Wenzhouxiangella limi]|uniref:N-(5'-phosphoribosyl)anthranilate isomerase n=1 Tax=Wenzhouxiangella limi TaxID=2707351 RepID=A0A845V9X4_9GAMM|nr:phosphoribosylanthranilate isomerase [Wenzhouxiangella limi]NDY96715.1 phosphoribosylanthranilate isomerase [Wenzhouxiangella limi]
MTRVKICGITSPEDAVAAAAAGADAIGLVFVQASRRCVSLEQARAICRALPPFVTRVGLFVDAPPAQVEEVLRQVPLDCLQFHGSESSQYCLSFGRPWFKAVAMGGDEAPDWQSFAAADALLLDSHGGGKLGGSGKTFDWERVPALGQPWILAGGLNPGNVGEACRRLRPDAVDVSSGVEIGPGIKDHTAMNEFIKAVRHA